MANENEDDNTNASIFPKKEERTKSPSPVKNIHKKSGIRHAPPVNEKPLQVKHLTALAVRRLLEKLKKEEEVNGGLTLDAMILISCIAKMRPELKFFLANENQILLMPEFREYALSLHFKPKIFYTVGASLTSLPSKEALKRDVKNDVDVYEGFNECLLKLVDLKMKLLKDISKHCVLCIYDIPVKPGVYYNITKDRIVGFENRKGVTRAAERVYVVMIRALYDTWKQPISYHLLDSDISHEDLQAIIFKHLDQLNSMGLIVKALTTSHSLPFYRVSKKLGVSSKTPYFLFNNQQIFYIFDVPKLASATRIHLLRYNFNSNKQIISMEHVKKMYEYTERSPIKKKSTLTKEQCKPKSDKNARDLFSWPVLRTMVAYFLRGILPANSEETIIFLRRMCDLISTLTTVRQPNGDYEEYTSPLGNKKTQFTLMDNMFKFFDTLKLEKNDVPLTQTIRFIEGWKVTLKSVRLLWAHTKVIEPVIFTSRLSTSSVLEFLPKTITSFKCEQLFQNYFFEQLFVSLKETIRTNELENLVKKVMLKKLNRVSSNTVLPNVYSNVSDIYVNDYSTITVPESEGFLHLFDFFAKKCLKKHTCSSCEMYVLKKSENFYKEKQKDNFPNNGLVWYLLRLEKIFLRNFPVLATNHHIGGKLFDLMKQVTFVLPCESFPHDYLIKLFVRVRINFTLKLYAKGLNLGENNTVTTEFINMFNI